MLFNYTFKNFRSFKEQASLTMKAGRQRTLEENLCKVNNYRVLPSAVIYGANASGKSNIIMSLAIMKEIVLWGSLEVPSREINMLELYPFVYNDTQSPMLFEIEFTNEGFHFIYGFSIMTEKFEHGPRSIISEELTVIQGDKRTKIFERTPKGVTLMKDKRALTFIKFETKLLQKFEDKININLADTELFLTGAFRSTISNRLAEAVLDFFKHKLVVVSDFTLKKANLTLFLEDFPDKDLLVWNRILDGFVKNADFGPQKIAFRPSKKEDKNSSDTELVSIYQSGERKLLLPAELMESRGTLKLLDFAIPFETLFSDGGVFVLDEFDAAIHPELIKGIIALFNDQTLNSSCAQLIFTTHNPIYLNNKIFRRDQIKFVEKDKDTFESIIFSLADFGSVDVRNDQNYLLNYFKGKYGALPFIDFSRLLEKEHKHREEE
jgi:hypothetical protein